MDICVSQLFGNSEEDEALEADTSEENANEVAALNRETEELKVIKEAAGSPDYVQKIFNKVFEIDVQRLLTMWGSKPKKPTPLNYDELKQMKPSAATEGKGLPEQKVWDLKENFDMFEDSVVRLSTRLLKERETQKDAILSFDKDDEDAMDFVTAASNLRAYVYDIEKKSLFDVKCKCRYTCWKHHNRTDYFFP